MDEEKESLFQKIGRSLKLEDEQYEEALPRSGDYVPEEDVEQNIMEEEYEEQTQPQEDYEESPRVTLTAAGASSTASKRTVKPKAEPEESDADNSEEGRLTVDVYETEDEIVIKSTIAGVEPENLDIDITGDSVAIRGKRPNDEEVSPENYFYQETYWGSFSRTIILPVEIDPNESEAALKNGILTVRLKKLSKARQKKLKVKVE